MRTGHRLAVLACSLASVVLVACGSGSARSASTAPASSAVPGHEMLTPAAADSLLRDPPHGLVLLDVRSPSEFSAGHIAGAIDLDVTGATFEREVAKLDPTTPYLVYCHSGNRSAQAVAYLEHQDFRSIYEIQGGIAAWQAAGLPVVTD